MPPFDLKATEYMLPGVKFEPKPYIVGWNRLEGRIRQEEFTRALRAEARDPLWFLARQWQFLELEGDDAGSPIEAQLAVQRRTLERFAVRDGAPRAYDREIPLEAAVEREPVPFDLVALVQVARAFGKALERDGVAASERVQILEGMRAAYPFDPGALSGVADEEAEQLAGSFAPFLFDAEGFLGDASYQASIDARAGLGAGLASSAKTAGGAVRSWWDGLYLTPGAGDDAWEPETLDYRFRCGTAGGADQIVLDGDGYANGRLDWFAFDVARPGDGLDDPAGGAGGGDGGGDGEAAEKPLSYLPSAIRFAGMPSHRFWEMEDAKVELGTITATTTDVAKILLTEFILAYGNDWCLIPVELQIGELCDTLALVVHDVFGDQTLVRPADRGKDEEWRRWAMFSSETRTTGDVVPARLFLTPATPKPMESAPLERVVFLRDEMANLVWAAESTIPSRAGIGIDGEQFSRSRKAEPEADPPPASGATARYRLGTDAPGNWRPFVPAHVPGSNRSVRLQRARLPDAGADPFGAILVGPGLAPEPYFIAEEEVPRAGRIVTRSFQRTRWLDGRVVVWLGRRTETGRGEGSSGLEFDVIEELPQR